MRVITNDMQFLDSYMPHTGYASEWQNAVNALRDDPELYGVILEKSSTDKMLTIRTRKGTKQVPNVL